MLKHEDWPGLEKISTLRGFQKDGSLKPMSILVGNGGCSSISKWSAAPTAP
jgi:4-hydroxy-tetrahydrodipicolinate synthase